MGILKNIVGEREPETRKPVEVVTLAADLTEGATEVGVRTFDDVDEALHFAKSLPKEELDSSFIRTTEVTETIEKAETERTVPTTASPKLNRSGFRNSE
jgi:hypothetical protein